MDALPEATKTVRMLTTERGASDELLEAGSTYELPFASADYWLVRDKAELVEDNSKLPIRSKKIASKPVDPKPTDDAAAAEAKRLADEEVAAQLKADAEARTAADARAAAAANK